MAELPRQSYSVPAIGGGDVVVQPERDHVLVFIDRGPGQDGLMAALTPRDVLRLVQHLLDASEAVR